MMSSETLPKLVEIASTKSLRTRIGDPVPVENNSGSGSVANRSRTAEAITFSRPSRRAFSTTTRHIGAGLHRPHEAPLEGPIGRLVRDRHPLFVPVANRDDRIFSGMALRRSHEDDRLAARPVIVQQHRQGGGDGIGPVGRRLELPSRRGSC